MSIVGTNAPISAMCIARLGDMAKGYKASRIIPNNKIANSMKGIVSNIAGTSPGLVVRKRIPRAKADAATIIARRFMSLILHWLHKKYRSYMTTVFL